MSDLVRASIESAAAAAESGAFADAWAALLPHAAEVDARLELAWAWLVLLERSWTSAPSEADVTARLLDRWPERPDFALQLAQTLIARVDGRVVERDASADDPAIVAAALLERTLAAIAREPEVVVDAELMARLFGWLGTALRLAGPSHDAAGRGAFEAAIARAPDHGGRRFDLGLHHKNRGRWAEALECFEAAAARGAAREPTQWNIAIAATALGRGATAQAAWAALGVETRLGPDGLPALEDAGRAKVRLSSRPVGGPIVDGPLTHEDVWVAPQSPCHGWVLTPPSRPTSAAYGDVILWDGAALEDARAPGAPPTFPMLARLRVGDARTFAFVAREAEPGTLLGAVSRWPDAVGVHVFDDGADPRTALRGVVIVEAEATAAEALALLDALAATAGLTIASPALVEAAGAVERVEATRRAAEALAAHA